MVKHNNVIPNGHFHKDWQRRIKTWFDQVRNLLTAAMMTRAIESERERENRKASGNSDAVQKDAADQERIHQHMGSSGPNRTSSTLMDDA